MGISRYSAQCHHSGTWGSRGVSEGKQWPVPGVPVCHLRLPGTVTHSLSSSSHTAAFPGDQGDVSEWQRVNEESRPLSLGPGWGAHTPLPCPGELGSGWLGGRTPMSQVTNQPACLGAESSKAWSCPALAKVGEVMRRLAGWDVMASKENARLWGRSRPSPQRTGRQPALCGLASLLSGLLPIEHGEAEYVLVLNYFCVLLAQSPDVLSSCCGTPVGLGQAAMQKPAWPTVQMLNHPCALGLQDKKQRVLFQAPGRHRCCLT